MSFFKPFEPEKEELARERKARSRGSGPQHSYELFRVPLQSQCTRIDQQAGGEDAVEKLCQLMKQPVGEGSDLFLSDRREEEKLPYRQSPYMKKEPICNFCKRNGETEAFYSSHFLKGPGGKVTCPVLRKYKCPMCGATGEHAHTIKYCPYNTERYSTVMTDRTQRKSCGCKIHHSCTNRTH